MQPENTINEYIKLFGLSDEEAKKIKKKYNKFNKDQRKESLALMSKIIDDSKRERAQNKALEGKRII